jgi:16S rRNA processing protein RimM
MPLFYFVGYMHAPAPKPDQGFIVVGKVLKAQGLKGDIYVHVFSNETSWLKGLTHFSLIAQSRPTLLMNCERSRRHKQGVVIKPKEIIDRNQSEALKGYFLQIPESLLTTTDNGDDFYLREILNFKVKDKDMNELGEIIGFSTNTAQDLAVLLRDQKEYQIPLVDHWILKVHRQEKWLVMDLPPGLLDDDI